MLEDEIDFDESKKEFYINKEFTQVFQFGACYSMFYSIQQSNKLKQEYEKENNFTYDIVYVQDLT